MKKTWWWRHKGRVEAIDEIPAFRYELARRLFPLAEYPDWTKLKAFERDIVRHHFRHGCAPGAIVHLTLPVDRHGSPSYAEGYSPLPLVSWNLKASDNALTSVFMQMIEATRREHKIEPPPRNTGNANRGVSWRWLELMDHPQNLDECGRSHLSQAKRKAGSLRQKFTAVQKDMAQARRAIANLEKDEAVYRTLTPFLKSYSETAAAYRWSDWSI